MTKTWYDHTNMKGQQKENDNEFKYSIALICITFLVIMCAGEPDLIDALVKLVSNLGEK
jgi:hypothetical protein